MYTCTKLNKYSKPDWIVDLKNESRNCCMRAPDIPASEHHEKKKKEVTSNINFINSQLILKMFSPQKAILVITDGVPDDIMAVEEIISDAGIKYKHDLSITFVQVIVYFSSNLMHLTSLM